MFQYLYFPALSTHYGKLLSYHYRFLSSKAHQNRYYVLQGYQFYISWVVDLEVLGPGSPGLESWGPRFWVPGYRVLGIYSRLCLNNKWLQKVNTQHFDDPYNTEVIFGMKCAMKYAIEIQIISDKNISQMLYSKNIPATLMTSLASCDCNSLQLSLYDLYSVLNDFKEEFVKRTPSFLVSIVVYLELLRRTFSS